MEEVSYEHREHIEETPGQDIHRVKVTTLVKVQRKKVLTNPDIEARKHVKKFGLAEKYTKGLIEPSITIDDKEVFLLPFGVEKNEESISAFVSTRNQRDKFEELRKKEKSLKEGKLNDERVKQTFTMEHTSFAVKVSNLPAEMTQQELEAFFSTGGRPRKVYRPVGRENGLPRDFAIINYHTKEEASASIKRFNNKKCGVLIIAAEHADSRGPAGRGRPPFTKK